MSYGKVRKKPRQGNTRPLVAGNQLLSVPVTKIPTSTGLYAYSSSGPISPSYVPKLKYPPKEGEYLTDEEKQIFLRNCGNKMHDHMQAPVQEFERQNNVRLSSSVHFSELLRRERIDCVVAGGAITTELLGQEYEDSDIDIFFFSMNEFKDAMDYFELNGYKSDGDFEKGNPLEDLKFITYTKENQKPIQLIKMVWYTSVEDIIDSFDITVCKFALYNDKIFYRQQALDDFKNRRLVIENTMFPLSLIRRIEKYSKRGFSLADGDAFMLNDMLYKKEPSSPTIEWKFEESKEKETSLWNRPEYREDYIKMEPHAFKRKWDAIIQNLK